MSVAPLPPGKRQFIDINGKPLEDGTVAYYAPGGLTPKDTWQDFDQASLNDNPLTLDARGQASIWGNGRYREIVYDADGNLIWDQETLALVTQSYEVGFYFVDPPAASDIICVWNFDQAAIFPTNFLGSFGSVNTDPSVDTDFDIKLNGSGIGTMTVSAAGAVTFTSSVSNPAFAIGDRLTIHTQSGGANSAAGIAATFLGALVS
jgi:hypothetical protein